MACRWLTVHLVFCAVLQSPAVKEVLKDQDGRKGLIAAICAGIVCENKPDTEFYKSFDSDAFMGLNMT